MHQFLVNGFDTMDWSLLVFVLGGLLDQDKGKLEAAQGDRMDPCPAATPPTSASAGWTPQRKHWKFVLR